MCLHVDIVCVCMSTRSLGQKVPLWTRTASECVSKILVVVTVEGGGGALKAFSQISHPSLDQNSSDAGFSTHAVVQLSVPQMTQIHTPRSNSLVSHDPTLSRFT